MSIDVLTVDYNDPDASKKFENSLKSSGFAIIKNHPIDKNLISKVYDEWVAFFNSKDKFDLLYDENSQDGEINFEFEPDEKGILSELLPKNLSIQIYKAILESGAGEQGARMAAMDNATRNAGEMIDKLNLSYNRQRQAIITGELIEIISGAEAL